MKFKEYSQVSMSRRSEILKKRDAFLAEYRKNQKPRREDILEPETQNYTPANLALGSGIDPYTGSWGKEQILHLLKRSLFGVKVEDYNHFKNYTMDQLVDALLSPDDLPEPPINNYNEPAQNFIDPDVTDGETWVGAPFSDDFAGSRIVSLKSWMIKNAINQERTIHQKMKLFWHNHLATQSWDVFVPNAAYKYFTLLHNFTFGNFRTLMKEITIDPHMLFFLNGAYSEAEAPDENYARELQELFTIGKGPNSNYTQMDVIEASRILTGWRCDWPDYNSYWASWAHDDGDKQFSEFYGNKVIEGKSGQQGQTETDELLDMLFENSELALFMVRNLYRFFIFNEISADAEENVIAPLAQIFRDNDYEILPVLHALFRSEHFFDLEIRGAIVKSPMDHLVGGIRILDLDFRDDDLSLIEAKYVYESIGWRMNDSGMELGDPPTVAGWPAWFQAPNFDKSWVNTNTITQRALDFDSMLLWNFWTPTDQEYLVDTIGFAKKFENPRDPNELIKDISDHFHGMTPGEDTLTNLKSILLSNQGQDYYWTQAWDNYQENPGDEMFRNIVENRLKWMLQRLLQLGESQLS